jgi:hypothetical protein
LYLDRVDPGLRRTAPAPGDEPVDGVRHSLEFGLDGAVGAVAYPAADALDASPRLAGVAEEDTLHPTGHDDSSSYGSHEAGTGQT